MATTVDSLYASMKALVCIIGNNSVALKEMERTGGFQVSYVCHPGLCLAVWGVCVCVYVGGWLGESQSLIFFHF